MSYEPRKGSVASIVLAWLRAQPPAEFSALDIATALDIQSTEVTQALRRMERHGLVRHALDPGCAYRAMWRPAQASPAMQASVPPICSV